MKTPPEFRGRGWLGHLLAAAEVHSAVLHGVQGIQTLASAQNHAGNGVVRHSGVNAGAGGHQLVKAVHQAAAAGHDNTVGGHIRHQLRGRPLQHLQNAFGEPCSKPLRREQQALTPWT